MARYTVFLAGQAWFYGEVKVEAESQEEAMKQAVEMDRACDERVYWSPIPEHLDTIAYEAMEHPAGRAQEQQDG